MFSIAYTIEAFDDFTYVDQVIASLPGLNRSAPRGLGSSQARAQFTRNAGGLRAEAKEASPMECGAIREVLTEVANTTPASRTA